MLIIEGPDDVGKSEFCRKLSKLLPSHEVRHLGILPKSWHYFKSYVDLAGEDVIADRFHMSELVYGYCCRNESKVDATTYKLIDAVLLTFCAAFTVVITTSGDRRGWNGHPLFTLEQLRRVNTKFHTIVTGLSHRYVAEVNHHVCLESPTDYLSKIEVIKTYDLYSRHKDMIDKIMAESLTSSRVAKTRKGTRT